MDVQIGVHNARTVDPLSVLLGREKGNELAKSFVRCPSPVSLKSLGLLAHAGSTPAPGTIFLIDYSQKARGYPGGELKG
jgi:hypothetical protein